MPHEHKIFALTVKIYMCAVSGLLKICGHLLLRGHTLHIFVGVWPIKQTSLEGAGAVSNCNQTVAESLRFRLSVMGIAQDTVGVL